MRPRGGRLTPARVDRRVKAFQGDVATIIRTDNECRRECKSAQQSGEKAPPHPTHHPDGWREYNQQRAWLEANGRG